MAELLAHDWSELATKSDLVAVRSDLAGVKIELKADIAVLGSDLRAELHKTITTQTRQMYFGLVGVVATFGGLMIAAGRIR